MKRFKPLLLVFLTFTLLGCKEDELDTEKYVGVWNFTTSQGCSRVMSVDAISDTEIKLNWFICMQGSCVATINGNQITIPYQKTGLTEHQASGTITENSMQFNAYRFGNQTGDWIISVSAAK